MLCQTEECLVLITYIHLGLIFASPASTCHCGFFAWFSFRSTNDALPKPWMLTDMPGATRLQLKYKLKYLNHCCSTTTTKNLRPKPQTRKRKLLKPQISTDTLLSPNALKTLKAKNERQKQKNTYLKAQQVGRCSNALGSQMAQKSREAQGSSHGPGGSWTRNSVYGSYKGSERQDGLHFWTSQGTTKKQRSPRRLGMILLMTWNEKSLKRKLYACLQFRVGVRFQSGLSRLGVS